MPATRHTLDRWATYCAECGTEDKPLRLDPEGPLAATPSITLRDMHNKAFHNKKKMTNHVPMSRYYVICKECFGDDRHLLDEATRDEAYHFVKMHNEAFHSKKSTPDLPLAG
jgi:hypothetical protein